MKRSLFRLHVFLLKHASRGLPSLHSGYPAFLAKKMAAFLSSPAILKGVLSLKTQKFAVKSISENCFTLVQKNSEYLELMELWGKVLSLRNLIFSAHLMDFHSKQCVWADSHLYLYAIVFR